MTIALGIASPLSYLKKIETTGNIATYVFVT